MAARALPHLHLATAGLFAGAFAVVLAIVLPVDHAVGLDHAVATWMAAHRTETLTSVLTAISTAGSVVGIVPASLVIAVVLYRRRGWRPVRWLALATLGATAVYLAINLPLGRARPPMGLRVYPDGEASFPSGHSTQAVAFWVAAATLLAAEATLRVRRLAYAGAALAIALTGLSRIYLCEHWTTDVLGGFALGAAWIAIVLAWRKWLGESV
ncbi:MAG TPA: phosphatase PAP2 family protein [Kofleriaceae bacterium]|nr:phosphatase PAP2 family protein [Kofleriaceae bacterium]